MRLEEAIYKRQSTRSYHETPLDDSTINEIKEFIDNAKPLNPDIDWSYEIVEKDKFNTLLPWKAPHYILMYSQEEENYEENIGFIFQQVDLFLQSREIASCWIGMGSPKKEDNCQKYIMAMAFGKTSQEIYRDKNQFKRKSLDEISDQGDEKLIPAQLAPSAINNQPWYFTHNGKNSYNIYKKEWGFVRRKILGKYNYVDVGIALAHMYISNKDTFNYYIDFNVQKIKGYQYIGTFEI